ncbi:ADP-ribosyl cyclase/cyclic ADP-ribose hydrolase [Aphelenchoides fujianensis]|nr:ADP-ribosyl cyclase/cyclic ADP-ribose hydrolase [Aphelenchoides fujianensis]
MPHKNSTVGAAILNASNPEALARARNLRSYSAFDIVPLNSHSFRENGPKVKEHSRSAWGSFPQPPPVIPARSKRWRVGSLIRKVPRLFFHMAGKAGGDEKDKNASTESAPAASNGIENERFPALAPGCVGELAQESVGSRWGRWRPARKSVDDVNVEENEPVAPLKRRPIVGLYSLKSPTVYNASRSFENGTTRSMNGSLNGSTTMVNGEVAVNGTTENKLNGFANENHPPISPSVSAPLPPNRSHPPVSPSTSVVILPSTHNQNWKTSSLRSTSSVVVSNNRATSPSGQLTPHHTPAIRQQATVDESHLSTTRSFSLKLEVPSAELPGSWSCVNSPQPSTGSAGFLYSASGSVESKCGLHAHGGDIRLQQSLSTPCPGEDHHAEMTPGPRKESEYRRFKSEGSTAGSTAMPNGAELDVAIDDLSPIGDHRSSPPHRLNLFQGILLVKANSLQIQDSVNGTLAKHSQTEQVLMMHTLKTKLQKYQGFIDKAFQLIQQGGDEQIFEGCTIVTKVMTKAWMFPKISHDLAYALCEYLREQEYFDILINLFIKPSTCESVRSSCGAVLEECMALKNRDYIVTKGYLKKLVATAEKLNKNQEQQRMSLSIMESLFKHSPATTSKLIEFGVLDHILLTCKRATDTPITLRHAAQALANLSLYSSAEAKKKIIQKKLPDWLFLLASQPDDITRYYACLAICMLGSSKEMEAAVTKSGTLSLVEPFLLAHQPVAFAEHDYKHSQGRPKEWLISPDEVAAKFASEALTIIGEEVPYKLSQQVPVWTISDVQYWVEKREIRFPNGRRGPLLLRLTEKELEEDLNIKSGLLRKRFMRELESLKIAADYSSVDETQLDQFLMSLGPELSVYTYQMLGLGLRRAFLPQLTNELASLIKVLLQLRGYKVFIDVDKLYAGKFDSHLLKNIQAAKHFILYHKNVIPIFDQHFEFPAVESELPDDIRQITKFNGVRWVHDYQEACVDKVERFIKGELNRTPSLGPNQISVRPSSAAGTARKTNYKLASSSAVRSTVSSVNRNKTTAAAAAAAAAGAPPAEGSTTATASYKLAPSSSRLPNQPLAIRSSSMEKQRRKLFSSSVSTVYSEK